MKAKLFFSLVILSFAISAILFPSCKDFCEKHPEDIDCITPDTNVVPVTCQLLIENGCLDEWQDLEMDGVAYYEPAGTFLRTLNLLSALPVDIGGPGPVTTEKCTDYFSGSYSAKLISANFCPSDCTCIFIPGLLGATTLDIPHATCYMGKPYTSKPTSLKGYYKYFPASGDSALIEVQLTRFNTALNKRDTLASTKNIIKNTVSSWTAFEFPLTYFDNVTTPDTVVLLCVSSAGTNFAVFTECKGAEGSTLYIDEIDFVISK